MVKIFGTDGIRGLVNQEPLTAETTLKISKTVGYLLQSKKNKVYFIKKNNVKKLFNLRKYVNDKLLRLNVKVDHVNHDTFKEKSSFFSFRRSQKLREKDYGRCISVISLV